MLGWLRMPPNTLKIIVKNRLAHVNELTGSLPWIYFPRVNVGSKSRGVTLDALRTSDLWWHGPAFLHECLCNFSYYHSCYNLNFNELPDIKLTTTLLVYQTNQNTFPFDRFSSFTRMKSVIAYMLRFIDNVHNKIKVNRKCGPLQVEELNQCVIKSQNQSFPDLDLSSKKNLPIKAARNIFGLNIFLDKNNNIRAGGRLDISSISSFVMQ